MASILDVFYLTLFFLTSTISAWPQTKNICRILESRLPERVSFPTNAAYNASLHSYYAEQERELSPGCIFRPYTTAEVSQFVKLVNEVSRRGQSNYTEPIFAIRGGGHTLFSGAANLDGGVTVDLRLMDSMVLSKDKRMASLGGGSIWSNVYPQLVVHNLTVLGGRVPGIGVGGFTLGGGKNFLSRRHGWDCDNVYHYEVVLSNGDIVVATATAYSDLWLALKGGSNNFGIVTRFDVATFPLGLMWGGVLTFNYTEQVLQAQTAAFSRFMDVSNFDDAADTNFIINFANGAFSVENAIFYSEEIANPPTFQPFTSIPNATSNSLDFSNVADLVDSFGKGLPSTLGRVFELVYSFKTTDAATYRELIQIWELETKSIAATDGLIVQFLLQPEAVTNGTNSLGLTSGEKDIVTSCITAAYTNAKDDSKVQKAVLSIVAKHESFLKQKGLYRHFKYLNYADSSQDPIGSYGAEIKARLQQVSRKYDPHGLFQKGVPGGFKLY